MAEKENAPQAEPSGNRVQRHHLRWVVPVTVFALVLSLVYWWVFKRNRVDTDDAYVRADSAQISSRISGTILRVQADNDFPFKEGDVLLELDPEDYRVALERARAVLAQDEAEVQAADVSIFLTDKQTAAQVQASEAMLKAARDSEQEVRHRLDELQNRRLSASADLSQSQRDFDRFDRLYRQGAGTERQQDQAGTTLKKAKAQTGATEAQIAAMKSSIGAAVQAVDRATAQLRAAQSERYSVEIQRYKLVSLQAKRDKSKAEMDAAALNLSYCTITAPISGYIAQKSIQVGDRVQPGQALMAVVPLREVYVEANYKETQLADVRVGQPVTFKADVYPGYTFRGRVEGIRSGTGATFSLLPAENATGNWIKVVQRVPVKIRLSEPPPCDRPLRLGFSLQVTIDISDTSGGMLVVETKKPPRGSLTPTQ